MNRTPLDPTSSGSVGIALPRTGELLCLPGITTSGNRHSVDRQAEEAAAEGALLDLCTVPDAVLVGFDVIGFAHIITIVA